MRIIATVATLLKPGERSRLDAAAQGSFAAYHARNVGDAVRAVREKAVRTVLVSPHYVSDRDLSHVGQLVRGFPGVSTVAVVSQHDAVSSQRLLELGAHGVSQLLDLSRREGWRRLREIVSHPTSPSAARILSHVLPALGSPTRDCRVVFEVFVRLAPELTTVRALTDRLGITSSTFMSRFFRAGLPSPKTYLGATRLLYAADLLETPGLSIAEVAYRLEYSSPQSFGRHLRTVLGLTASEYRRRYSFQRSRDDFVRRLILPYQDTFRVFHPLDSGVGALGLR